MKHSVSLFFILLFFSACSPQPTPAAPAAVPAVPAAPDSSSEPLQTITTAPTRQAPPAPSLPAALPLPPEKPAAYLPAETDSRMERAPAFIDSFSVRASEAEPGRPVVMLKGSVPTPCHHLRLKLSTPDSENRLNLEVYSVVEPGILCAQVLEPFEVSILAEPLPGPGEYQLTVNSAESLHFKWPLQP